jgi:NAD(P)-dependent dehydrogenase (short-subunit alcohol dehydrogenase family)
MLETNPLILVTGSSDGIGLETARTLAHNGATVLLHGRNLEKTALARKEVEAACSRSLPEPVLGDLSSLKSAVGIAAELQERGVFPDVLVNNAGVFCKERVLSVDGIEQTMAINHFGPFALTRALLTQTGQRLRRIINVSSIAHTRGQLDLADLRLVKRRFDGYGAYAASKLANVQGKTTVNALHPGVVSTKLLREGFGSGGSDSLADGAATSVMLALDPQWEHTTGQYFASRRPAAVNPLAKDLAFCRAFFEETERIVDSVLASSRTS